MVSRHALQLSGVPAIEWRQENEQIRLLHAARPELLVFDNDLGQWSGVASSIAAMAEALALALSMGAGRHKHLFYHGTLGSIELSVMRGSSAARGDGRLRLSPTTAAAVMLACHAHATLGQAHPVDRGALAEQLWRRRAA